MIPGFNCQHFNTCNLYVTLLFAFVLFNLCFALFLGSTLRLCLLTTESDKNNTCKKIIINKKLGTTLAEHRTFHTAIQVFKILHNVSPAYIC